MLRETNIVKYKAEKCAKEFIKCNALENYIVGPIGSGKTVSAIMKCWHIASTIMKDPKDGVRKSIIIVSRKTEMQLHQGFAADFCKWFPPDGKYIIYRKKLREIEIDFPNEMHCMIYLVPLDSERDKARLLGTNVSAVLFDEFVEVDLELIAQARGRVGRYPATKYENNDYTKRIIYGCFDDAGRKLGQVFGSTNAPEGGTDWAERIDYPPEGIVVIRQPSGLSDEAENLAHLPPDFYQDKAKSNDPDWVRRYVHGLTGKSKKGKPVYSGFVRDLHVTQEEMFPLQHIPVIVGMDFGRDPSAVFCQQTQDGQVRVIDELPANGMGVKTFLKELFTPMVNNKYLGCDIHIFGDPSGITREGDERSCFDRIQEAGFQSQPASTNTLADRLESVNDLFSRQIQGKPAILVNKNCSFLIAGLDGKYHYETDEKDGFITKFKPKKDGYSHIQDALQYACLYYNRPSRLGEFNDRKLEIEAFDFT